MTEEVEKNSESKIQKRISTLLTKTEEGTLRHDVLLAVRDFRNAWVNMGKLLVKVKTDRAFKEWGYNSLEQYAKVELGLKKPTVDKLTNSMAYLKNNEDRIYNQIENGTPPAELPNYESLDVLFRADKNKEINDRQVASLRESVFADNIPANEVKNQYKGFLPEKEETPDAISTRQLRRIKRIAVSLQEACSSCDVVPTEISNSIANITDSLHRLEVATEPVEK